MSDGPQTVVHRVPASTSNLGAGFDCLGLALALHNEVRVCRSPEAPREPFFREAARVFFEATGRKPFGFACAVAGEVPSSRGLGSSVTVRLGLLHGLNVLCGEPLDDEALFRLCCRLEGHPDNAAASAFGGLAICRADGARLRLSLREESRLVLLIPDFEIPTPEARKLLPQQVSLGDAVWNLSHTAFLVAAVAGGNLKALREAGGDAFSDRWHQPPRSALIPFLAEVIKAGRAAGALGGWLSGSGSTIACLATESEDADAIASAMQGACPVPASTRIVAPDNEGVRRLE